MTTPEVHQSQREAEGFAAEAPEPGVNRRRIIGLIVGIVAAVAVFLLFPDNAMDAVREVGDAAEDDADYSLGAMRITAAVAVLMAVWWMTEAIPLAVTALVPLVAFPLSQVIAVGDISGKYAEPTIFLFMGGFVLALGLQRWNVHRRLALAVVLAVGTRPRRLVLGFMIATGFMSMWVSNTATAVVMLPIGIAVLKLTADQVGGMGNQKRFATALMLAIAYSASIGSVGTIIGTPPNALLVAYMSENHGVEIGFGQWMLVGVPLSVVFMLLAWLVLVTVFKPEMDEIPGGRELIKKELAAMKGMSAPEIRVAIVFVAAALSWIFVPVIIDAVGSDIKVADAVIAIAAAVLLFLVPAGTKPGVKLMDWAAAKELPWDVLLLFGGGLALSSMFSESGLSLWIGSLTAGLAGVPTIVFIAVVALIVLALTEFTSNTASAATFLPILAGVAMGIGLNSGGEEQNILLLTIPVALAATCAFMLPVATPPNAIAFGSGYVKISEMIKGGVWLNAIAVVLVTLVTYFIAVPVFGIVL